MWHDSESFLAKDKYIGPLVKKWGNCTIKIKPQKDYFAALCGDIIGQQLSGKVADVIEVRFKTVVGELTPKNVLNVPEQKLRDCGMSWAKVSFVKDLAKKTISGELGTDKLMDLPDEEVITELVAIKGIGRWTAEMFLMFSLGRPDVFPLDDLGIKKAFEKVVQQKWDRVKSARFAERYWKPHRTVASWYLWRSLENK